MRLRVLYVLVLGLLSCQGPAFSRSDTSGAEGDNTKPLLAGNTAPNGRFSYMCSLRYQETHEHFCGAVLIRLNWILTAAHCIDGKEDNAPVRPIVYCGIDRLDQTDLNLIFDAGHSYTHECWNGVVGDGYDIAVVKLERDAPWALENLPELDAGDNNFTSGHHLTALGWGATPNAWNPNDLKTIQSLEFVPSGTCNEKWWDGDIDEERMICAFGSRKKSVCDRDSGGPLIRADNPGGNLTQGRPSRDLVIGITSFNYEPEKCGQRKRPAVFTRVASFVDWINKKIGEDVTEGRRPVQSSRIPAECGTGSKELYDLSQRELVVEMKKALKEDDEARAKRILEHLHVDESLNARIPGARPISISLLHAAALFDAPKCAQVLIDSGADVKAENRFDETPLHYCSIVDSISVATVLIDNEADVNAIGRTGYRPLHYASSEGYVKLVELLLDSYADAGIVDDSGETPLNKAVRNGRATVVKVLLSSGADPNAKADDGETNLHVAALHGHVRIAELLLKQGVDVDVANENGETALHVAARENRAGMVEFLIKEEADVNAMDESGHTPLHSAAAAGSAKVIRVLLESEVDIDAEAAFGETPLSEAAYNGRLDVVELLLEYGADAKTASRDGETALHAASFGGDNPDVVKALLEGGALIGARYRNGTTALHAACKGGHIKVVKVLIEEGADVDAKDNMEQTPLHSAAVKGHAHIAKILLETGTDVDATDSDGKTPLHYAAEYGHLDAARVLVEAGASRKIRDENDNRPEDIACERADPECTRATRLAIKALVSP